MKTYIYTTDYSSSQRGYNRTITVYRVINNKPVFVNIDNKINTASYRGDLAIASHIIADTDNHKISDNYNLDSKNIRVLPV